MRIKIKCPVCGRTLCRLEKGNEAELSCRDCKAVLVIGLVKPPIDKYIEPDTS